MGLCCPVSPILFRPKTLAHTAVHLTTVRAVRPGRPVFQRREAGDQLAGFTTGAEMRSHAFEQARP
ncbi:hypothetical protein E2562_031560 [Oryza meyeriana var. granulata]|uniref:Uncharacterized protein n=1 Tax=Oryza meyeriana var. granulata TaxID=110450 RepID=A0A6G1CTR3_9ORYZ|nr:hypothetical protein E2562_031560 [Oryza meyeriana var. granulata]